MSSASFISCVLLAMTRILIHDSRTNSPGQKERGFPSDREIVIAATCDDNGRNRGLEERRESRGSSFVCASFPCASIRFRSRMQLRCILCCLHARSPARGANVRRHSCDRETRSRNTFTVVAFRDASRGISVARESLGYRSGRATCFSASTNHRGLSTCVRLFSVRRFVEFARLLAESFLSNFSN